MRALRKDRKQTVIIEDIDEEEQEERNQDSENESKRSASYEESDE